MANPQNKNQNRNADERSTISITRHWPGRRQAPKKYDGPGISGNRISLSALAKKAVLYGKHQECWQKTEEPILPGK
jgi:hypothetical protein